MPTKPAVKRHIDSHDGSANFISIFPSPLGWIGIIGRDELVYAVLIGHESADSVRKAARQSDQPEIRDRKLLDVDWHPTLKARLLAYADGEHVAFDEFQLQLPPHTAFRDRVLAATKRLGYGETTTYGELAKRVGHPGAARAVGTVMSTNRFPILIPCHRVLAAGGKLGGYTAPSGVGLKQRLLDLERIR